MVFVLCHRKTLVLLSGADGGGELCYVQRGPLLRAGLFGLDDWRAPPGRDEEPRTE
jgi:hypothetical protein